MRRRVARPYRGFGQDFPADTNGEVQNTDAADGLRFEITGFCTAIPPGTPRRPHLGATSGGSATQRPGRRPAAHDQKRHPRVSDSSQRRHQWLRLALASLRLISPNRRAAVTLSCGVARASGLRESIRPCGYDPVTACSWTAWAYRSTLHEKRVEFVAVEISKITAVKCTLSTWSRCPLVDSPQRQSFGVDCRNLLGRTRR